MAGGKPTFVFLFKQNDYTQATKFVYDHKYKMIINQFNQYKP